MTALRADVEQDARCLVALYDERCNLAATMARSEEPTGTMTREVLAKGEQLDAAAEEFRRLHYPKRPRVVVGLWSVIVGSPTLRRFETVIDLFDEYRREAAR